MFPFDKPQYIAVTKDQKLAIQVSAHSAEHFLRFMPRNIKNYPSHGIDHTLQIIKDINRFLKNWNLSLKREERFLLYLAAWLHDIGCIKSRKNHNKISVKLVNKEEAVCNYLNWMDNDLLVSLNDVIIGHSSNFNLNQVPIHRGNVRVRLICAIFRLIDACEITNFKCPENVYREIKNTLNSEAIEFWVGHINIRDVTFQKPLIEVHVNNRNKTKKIVDRLKNENLSIKKIFMDNGIIVPIIKVRLN